MSLRRSRRHSPLANALSNTCSQGQGFTVSELAIPGPSQRQRQQKTTFSSQPVFELAAAGSSSHRQIVRHPPSSAYLLKHRPQALLARVPQAAVLFTAGAVAGAVGKTLTAPLDRVKLLLQTRGGLQSGAVRDAARHGSVWQALQAIGREEGIRGYWKGNLPQASRTLAETGCILRVVPYSATQLYSYEVLKRRFRNKRGELTVPARLAAGGCAGMVATLVTYPLDTLRLRIAVDPQMRSIRGASIALFREGSYNAFFRGLGASLVGIAPYMAMELASYDLLSDRIPSFARGFSAALLATSICYPLDTVRRHIQLQAAGGIGFSAAAGHIFSKGGPAAFYKGFLPNALKNLPNKSIKLSTFDAAKHLLAGSQAAYNDELAKFAACGRD
eukprot:jgi/Astpho2/1559/e_gw1.00026.53.1_t